jgi:hypothetical protein
MAKGTWYLFESPNPQGVRPLSVLGKTLPLAPGPWRARLTRIGLEDEIIAGSSDILRAAVAAGDKNTSTQSLRGSETRVLAAGLPVFELAFDVPADGKLPLAVSLVLDRGEAPEMIEEFRSQIIAKAPAGTTPAIVTAALTAAFPDIAIAVAVASFVTAADRILTATFGKHTALARPLDLVPTAGASQPRTLCLTHLPDPGSINVGHVPRPADFGLSADGHLIETRRDRELLEASSHEGYVVAQRSYAVLELTQVTP